MRLTTPAGATPDVQLSRYYAVTPSSLSTEEGAACKSDVPQGLGVCMLCCSNPAIGRCGCPPVARGDADGVAADGVARPLRRHVLQVGHRPEGLTAPRRIPERIVVHRQQHEVTLDAHRQHAR